MFVVIKEDYDIKRDNLQIKVLGVFSDKGIAFSLAEKHSMIPFKNDAKSDEEKVYWFVEYQKRDHKYLVGIHKVEDNVFDEVEVLNVKLGAKLGYAFTW